ncbi:MAG: threonine aldolase family protein [Bacteroidales bacterium]
MNKRGFASDNNAPVHEDVLKAILDANTGHEVAYGDDPYTRKASKLIRSIFGEKTIFYPVFTGTAANVLGLSAVTRSYNAIICAESAHVNVDECGAPEKFSGCKLLTLKTPDGKLTPELIKQHLHGFGFEHHVQPSVITITQATELGTVYTIDEIKAITSFAHEHDMLVHLDGARLANAAASLKCTLADITTNAGVDIVSFGGTKNGMMYGEAVLFMREELAPDFKYIRKQGMQLASKMRYISAQFIAYLQNDLWLKNADHANNMARLLYEEVREIKGVKVTRKPRANGVFAVIPHEIIEPLQEEFFFYVWDETLPEVRWMTSFDTTREDVVNFSTLLKKIMKQIPK